MKINIISKSDERYEEKKAFEDDTFEDSERIIVGYEKLMKTLDADCIPLPLQQYLLVQSKRINKLETQIKTLTT